MSLLQYPVTSREALSVVEEWEERISMDIQDLVEVLKKIDERDDYGFETKRRLRMLTESLVSRLSSEIESYRIEKIDLTGKNTLSNDDIQHFEKMNKRFLRLQSQIENLVGNTLGLEDLSSKSKGKEPKGILKKLKSSETSQRERGLDTTTQSRDLASSTRSRKNSKGEELKGYMEETFSHKMSRNVKDDTSLRRQQQVRSPQKSLSRNPSRERDLNKNKLVQDLNSDWVDNLLKKFGSSNKKLGRSSSGHLSSKKKMNITAEAPSDGVNLLMNELNALNTICNSMNRKIDTHTHPEYDNELEKIKIENSKISAEFKLLQQENSEIIKKIHRLKSKFHHYQQRNDEVLKRLRLDEKENTMTIGKMVAERSERSNLGNYSRQQGNESHIASSSGKTAKSSNPASQSKRRYLLEYPESSDQNLRLA